MITWAFNPVMAGPKPPRLSDASCRQPAKRQALRVRGTPKGRRCRSRRRAKTMPALLGDAPRRRDLLIEHLHKIQDRFGHLSAAHLVALAAEMKMAMAEVYEVATFYHHFDVVKEGETRRRRHHRPRLRLDCLRARRVARAARDAAGAARHATSACSMRRASAAARRRRSPWSARTRCPHATAEKVVALVKRRRRSTHATIGRHHHAGPPRLRGLSRRRRLCAGGRVRQRRSERRPTSSR